MSWFKKPVNSQPLLASRDATVGNLDGRVRFGFELSFGVGCSSRFLRGVLHRFAREAGCVMFFLFLGNIETVASRQHCIDHNTASARLSKLGAAPAAQVSGGQIPPSTKEGKTRHHQNMAAAVHVSQLWQPKMRSDDLYSHRGTTRKSTHSSPLKGVHLMAKETHRRMKCSLFLSSFKIWNLILFILFLAIGLDELTCVLSFSQAHQDPYHDAPVLFALHVKRRWPSFRQRSIEGCDGTTPRRPCVIPVREKDNQINSISILGLVRLSRN